MRLRSLVKNFLFLFFLFLGVNANAQITLSQSQATSCFNTNVVFTATITPDPFLGSVDLYDGSVKIATATLNNGSAVFNINNLSGGSHSLTAKFLLVPSNTINHTVNPAINPGSITTTGGVFCSGGSPGTINGVLPASGGNGTLIYAWQSSPDCNTWSYIPGATSENYTPAAITQTTCFRRSVSDECGNTQFTGPAQFSVYPQPVSQTINALPALVYSCSGTAPVVCMGNVCAGTGVSATFSGGSTGIPGRSDFTDVYQYSTDGGVTWNAYTQGSTISTTGLSGSNIVRIRTQRVPAYTNLGCSPSAWNEVSWTVNPLPLLTGSLLNARTSSSSFIYSPQSNVNGATFNWSRAVLPGISNPASSGTDGINESLVNTTRSAINVTYKYFVTANGCTNEQDVVLTINGNPPAIFSVTGGGSYCQGGSGVNVGLSGSEVGVNYQLVLDGTTNVGSPIAGTGAVIGFGNQTTAGNYTVVATDVSSGTTSTMSGSVTVTVNPTPVATATPSSPTICSGTATSIALTSNVGGTTFAWTVTSQTGASGATAGSGSSIAQTLTATGATAGTVVYSVTPTASGCSGTPISVTVTVNPTPVGSAPAQSICSGSTSSIGLNSTLSGTTYTWTSTIQTPPTGGSLSGFSNCSSSCGTNIVQTLTNSGTTPGVVRYNITPTSNGCIGNTFTVDLTVNPLPKTNIGVINAVCMPPSTTTNVPYSGTSGGANQYSIDFDNSANGAGFVDVINASFNGTSGNFLISLPSNAPGGVYNAVITIKNSTTGCVSQNYPITFTVNTPPVVTLQPVSAEYCRNNPTFTFQALASGYPSPSIQWQVSKNGNSWSDIPGATSLTYTFTPANTDDGNWYRALFTNVCASKVATNPAQLTINGGVNFPNQDYNGYRCQGGTSATFCVKATGGVGLAGTLSFYWEYSLDGNPPWNKIPGTDGTHANSGNFTTCYTATAAQLGYHFRAAFSNNGCLTYSQEGVVITNPTPTIIAIPDKVYCNGQIFSIPLTGTNVTSWSWTNSNPAIGLPASGTSNPITDTATNTGTTPITGTIVVTPIYTAGGVSCPGISDTFLITVNPVPPCSISGPNNICPGSTNTYSATSGMSTYIWTITGNGTISGSSTGQTVSVVAGASCGSYTLTVTITNSFGCSTTCSQTFNATDNTAPTWTTAAGSLNRTVACGDATALAAAQALSPVATDNCNGTITYTKTPGAFAGNICGGTYTNTWTAKDVCNNVSLVFTQVITVQPAPVAAFVSPPGNVTVTCLANVPAIPTVTYSNGSSAGCLISGSVTAVRTGNVTCNGTLTDTWTFTDACNRTISGSRVITITYSGGLTPPANVTATVSCPAAAIDPGAPAAITDACGRTVNAVLVGSTSTPSTITCGGTVVWTYRYTACDGTTTGDWTYTYNVTPPTFTVPADQSSTVACASGLQTPTPPVVTDN
ncbi:MAG: HYR-like domain-containing protein, partial [Flavisolibacter sp.]